MLTRNNSDENYYTEGDHNVQKMMNDVYADAVTINQGFWEEADIDTRFKAGDQSVYGQLYGNFGPLPKKQFYFNRIRRICNMVTGHQRQNRKSTVAVPVEHNDDRAASQWTKLLFHTMKRARADEMISEGFEHGSVTTGMSLVNMWMDYTKDPESGDICLDHVPFNSFLIDPYFKKKDLSDCNFIWRRQWLSKEAVKSIVPQDMEGFIDSMSTGAMNDGKFQYMAESYNYAQEKLLSYDEYWYKSMREATFVIDPQFGLSREWTGDDQSLEEFVGLYSNLIVKKMEVPTVKLAVQVQGKSIYDGANPLGIDQFPFVPFLGYYEPNIPYFPLRAQGMVRGLRDSQYIYNRRKVIELDILESQVNSGFKYKPTSMVDPSDIFMTGQGKGIALKQEAQMTDVESIPAPGVPASMIQLSEIMGREMLEVSGVNEELLGAADDDKAGVLAMLRQGAGLTTLQVLFDQLESTQKQLGGLFVEVIQKNYSVGKVARILGEEPVQEFKDKTWLNYDIRIEEGVNTSTQRQMAFKQMLHLRELGIPVPTETLLDLATVQDKDKLMAAVQQTEQQQNQMQMMEMEQKLKVMNAQIESMEAKALSDRLLGVERLSRTNENQMLAENRASEAVENMADARLTRAKTLKELQDIDLNQIQKMIELSKALESLQAQNVAIDDNLINQIIESRPSVGLVMNENV